MELEEALASEYLRRDAAQQAVKEGRETIAKLIEDKEAMKGELEAQRMKANMCKHRADRYEKGEAFMKLQ